MKLGYTVTEEDALKNVKFILKHRLSLSERLIKKLKYAGRITSNATPVYINASVLAGDILEVDLAFDDINEDILPERMDLDILYEDDSLIALNKPPDMVVHPTSYHFTGTMANGVMDYLLGKGIRTRIRPVSRLDRDTSGIIIFALNSYVQEKLIRQMHENTYHKEYVGIVHGNMKEASGVIDLPIERKPGSIMLRHVSASGAPSVTRYEVLEHLKDADYVRFILETGRTHQIRVHCQAIGHPLVGDTLYPALDGMDLTLKYPTPSLPSPGSAESATSCFSEDAVRHGSDFKEPVREDTFPPPPGLLKNMASPGSPDHFVPAHVIGRHALHSLKTSFIHPVANNFLELTAPVPPDISRALEILKK